MKNDHFIMHTSDINECSLDGEHYSCQSGYTLVGFNCIGKDVHMHSELSFFKANRHLYAIAGTE